MSTRKADGYIAYNTETKFYDWTSIQIKQGTIEDCFSHPYVERPFCFCPPELLDWVEKIKNQLEVQSSGWCKSLVDELNAIMPEEK